MAKLAKKHKALVDRYLLNRNGARAAVAVGYAKTNARFVACDILKRPEVKAYLDQRTEELENESRLAAYLVREELAILAHSDIRNFVVDAKGEVKLAKGVPDEAWRAVSSIEYETLPLNQRKVKIRLWPKNDAIRIAAQHLGMLKEHVEVTGKDGGPIEVDTESARLRILARLAKLEPAKAP